MLISANEPRPGFERSLLTTILRKCAFCGAGKEIVGTVPPVDTVPNRTGAPKWFGTLLRYKSKSAIRPFQVCTVAERGHDQSGIECHLLKEGPEVW